MPERRGYRSRGGGTRENKGRGNGKAVHSGEWGPRAHPAAAGPPGPKCSPRAGRTAIGLTRHGGIRPDKRGKGAAVLGHSAPRKSALTGGPQVACSVKDCG